MEGFIERALNSIEAAQNSYADQRYAKAILDCISTELNLARAALECQERLDRLENAQYERTKV